MNVFYCSCIHEPWLEVAQKLAAKGYQPTYWIGWQEGEDLVSRNLPSTIYHDINMAWKGVFPEQVQGLLKKNNIDGAFLDSIAQEELMAIRMMDRLDRDLHSFPFIERQLFFRSLLNHWYSVLSELKIDLIIFPSIPHRVFDYVISILAEHLNIPYVTFNFTPFRGHVVPMVSTLKNMPDLTSSKSEQPNLKTKEYFDKILTKSYKEIEPEYIQKQKQVAAKSFSKRVFDKAKKSPQNLLNMFDTLPIFWKRKGKAMAESKFSRAEVYQMELKANKYKSQLKQYYQSITEKPDFTEKYIVVGLHYQPEATSIPSGNIYADQFLLIQSLLKHTKGYQIYVKEHPTQFLPQSDGHTGRIKEFYDLLLSEERVTFIPIETDNFQLIENAEAVATIMSNLGLEALVKGKPVIVFGNAWYEHLHGVLKIKDNDSLAKIGKHISNFTAKPDLLLQQFSNTINQSLRANHYKRVASLSDVSNEESIMNLVNYITSAFPNE